MTKTEYREYIASAEWQQRRKDFLHDEGEKCSRCSIPRWLASIAYDQDLHVHHKSYANLGHEDWDDLEPLCRRCHEIESFGRTSIPEPKSSLCIYCGERQWDPREDMCPLCLFVFDCRNDRKSIADYCKLDDSDKAYAEIKAKEKENCYDPFWGGLDEC